jgi:glycosyltransferase involved in cell wall biosynthesis
LTAIAPNQNAELSPLRKLWRRAPTPMRLQVNVAVTSLAQKLGQVRGQLERNGRKPQPPVCVMGLHRAVLGIGRGARLFQDALDEMGVATTAWDVSALLGNDLTLPAPASDPSISSVVVTHLNPVEHLHALALCKGPRPKPGFRIGYWAWETSRIPDTWLSGIAAVDEIWCPSTFTAKAIREVVGNARPIRVVAHPITPSLNGQPDKAKFGIANDKITFFAACDMRSSLDRKNPLGAIEAFAKSGCGTGGQAELLVKVHGDFPGSKMADLLRAANQTAGVRIMDKRLSAEEMKVLRSSIDIVLSPHRSEGFGLVLAEAMRAGKPVIATGWSGNMDFMDGQSAALINFKEVPVHDSTGTYNIGDWAEPDLDHAAILIKRLTHNAQEREEIGRAGLAKINAFAHIGEWQKRMRPLIGAT